MERAAYEGGEETAVTLQGGAAESKDAEESSPRLAEHEAARKGGWGTSEVAGKWAFLGYLSGRRPGR